MAKTKKVPGNAPKGSGSDAGMKTTGGAKQKGGTKTKTRKTR